jgi:hypothetical protein
MNNRNCGLAALAPAGLAPGGRALVNRQSLFVELLAGLGLMLANRAKAQASTSQDGGCLPPGIPFYQIGAMAGKLSSGDGLIKLTNSPWWSHLLNLKLVKS